MQRMRIVNTTCVYKPGSDVFKVVDRLCGAGFNYLDLALDYCFVEGQPFLSDGWLDWAKSLRKYAESKGAQFVQCHGVCLPSQLYANPSHIGYRSIGVAEALGIKWIVMHPQQIEGTTDEIYDDFYAEQNATWFRPFLNRCADKGIGLAIENLPWPNCNRAKPLAQIVDLLDSPYVGVCWDTGHANINHFPPEMMKVLGDRLVTLHIHDNSGGFADEHQIPFYGTYDWEAFIHTLREINYKGDFVLEAHHQMLDAPDEETRTQLLAEMMEVSNRIMQMP